MMQRREFNSFLAVSLSSLLFDRPSFAEPPARKILAIADVHRKIYQHDAVSHALATIERLGREVGSSRVDLQACKLEYSIVSPK